MAGELIHAVWSGPLPPPAILAQYERVRPGSAERIFASFEQQVAFRRQAELAVIEADIRAGERDSQERRRGQYLAFVLCLAAIAGGTWAGLSDHQLVGSVIGGTGLAGLAAAFIYGRATAEKH